MMHYVLLSQTQHQRLSGSPFKILVLLAVLFASSVGSSIATTINVPPAGIIQGLIDAANPGDVVVVPAGTYNENVVINKSITLVSAGGRASTFINGSPGSNGTVVIAALLGSYRLITFQENFGT